MKNLPLNNIQLFVNSTLRDAMLAFEKNGWHTVFLTDESHRLVGLVTEGDLRRALLDGYGLNDSVLTIANKEPVVGQSSASREELAGLLSDLIACLPIVDENNVLVDVLFHSQRTYIPVATPTIGERELRYVTDAVLSGWVSSRGKYINQFESAFAEFCGTRTSVSVCNGTAALHLALLAAGVMPEDEVIVPALTFVSTASTVKHCFAKPVFVDVDPDTWNMNPDLLEAAITDKTKAIVPVHLYGNPCDMDPIMEIAAKHNLVVIEDAAEAHGAEYKGRRTGSLGHMACFSFFGNKLITTGEGGSITLNDPAYEAAIRKLRDHGMSPEKRYWHDVVGYNYRMTNLQAALGVAQLERWDEIYKARNAIEMFYDEHLPANTLHKPKPTPESSPICWLYSFLINPEVFGLQRNDVLGQLQQNDIDSRSVFIPLPAMPPYYVEDWEKKFPVATTISKTGLSLPSYTGISTEQLQRICDCIIKLAANEPKT